MSAPFFPENPDLLLGRDGTVLEWRQASQRFIGEERLIEVQKTQVAILRSWAEEGQWDWIRSAHYDWWLFPVGHGSLGCGGTYACPPEVVERLSKNRAFCSSLHNAADVMLKSWGWDLEKEAPHSNGRSYNGPDVRLGKMAESLLLFQLLETHRMVQAFARAHLSEIHSTETKRHLGLA